jgi:hypothetical protein
MARKDSNARVKRKYHNAWPEKIAMPGKKGSQCRPTSMNVVNGLDERSLPANFYGSSQWSV